MGSLFLRCGLVLLAPFLFTSMVRGADFYPPLPVAKSAIDFDNRGFLIHGQRTFIASASIEYARVPRALWRDRLLRIKRAGFNCIEIYTFWNYHEVRQGQFDFTGDKDVGAFLDLAHELGLFITVRVGPYVCAEWENGGFPTYLRFQPGLRIRQNEPIYLKDVDSWYDHILPIVASRQIERGGGVILVQLENEDEEGWGTVADWQHDPYFTHLLDKARAFGIAVPTFFSGMHHGGDPAPRQPIRTQGRPDPWFTTEFWSGWFSMYGPLPSTGKGSLTHFDRAAWRFLENGANGFNIYMFHGGTNFATWNDDETAASYDYAGAIGQAGDLRPVYYKYKRVALFGRSFQDILENCDDATAAHRNDFPGLTVRARKGPAGTLVFLDNPSDGPVDAKFPDGQTLTLAPGELTGLVRDFPLGSNLKLVSTESRILGVARAGELTTLVLFGPVGSSGRMTISGFTDGPLPVSSAVIPKSADQTGQGWSSIHDGKSTLTVMFPADGVSSFSAEDGRGHTLRVLAMNNELADDTFFIDSAHGNDIVTGAPYVGDFNTDSKGPHFTMEVPFDATTAPAVSIFGAGMEAPAGASIQERLAILENYAKDREASAYRDWSFPALPLSPIDTNAPALANWQSASANAEAAIGYDDSAWKTSTAPLPMGADGDTGAYAWYRTKIEADAAGTKYLRVPYIGDHAIVFVDGSRIEGTFGPGAVTIPLPLRPGSNSLAILVSHSGRNKFYGTYGAIDRLDMKGLVGPVTLLSAPTPQLSLEQAVARPYWQAHPPVATLTDPHLDTSAMEWKQVRLNSAYEYTPGSWRAPFVCIRTTLPDLAGPGRMLHAGLVDEKGAFYLNGRKIGEAQNDAELPGAAPQVSDGHADLALDAAWKTGGPNQLTLVLENAHAQATVGLLTLTSGAPGVEIQGWKMRGGVMDRTSPALTWSPVIGQVTPTPAPVAAPTASVPTYYRTDFNIPADYYLNATPILRLSIQGLSRGFAWLNGHNLGRYPEKIPVNGLYLPECWLNPGLNHLVILDEEGAPIPPAHLYIETAASRRLLLLSFSI